MQTLVDALTSPPGSAPYKAIIPLIGWEVLREIYDVRKPALDALQKYGQVYILYGRYVISLAKHGEYVDVGRMNAGEFFLVYFPALRGGAEVGLVEPHVWILVERGAKVYEVHSVSDVKAVLAEIKRIVVEDDATKGAALHIDARIRDINEALLQMAVRNIEGGAEYLRGLIIDTIASVFRHADKEVFDALIERLEGRWKPLLEALGISVKDVIGAEVRETAEAGATAERLGAPEPGATPVKPE